MNFGSETFRAGVDLSTEEFWQRMTAPDAPWPTTAASSPGEFKDAYEAAFAAGAEAIISVHVAGTLSGTIKSAQIARDMLPDREIHVIDSLGASMAQGILAELGVRLAAEGRSAAEIAETLESRAPDMRMYVALETLEYLRKGGRISGARGGHRHVALGQADHRGEARHRRHRRPCPDAGEGARTARRADLRAARSSDSRSCTRSAPTSRPFATWSPRGRGLDPSDVSINLVGASVGPHLGPGCVGAAILYRA